MIKAPDHRQHRQKYILEALSKTSQPIPGQEFANQLQVTRQVVVHDIALLRSRGHEILSTARGYCLQSSKNTANVTVLSVVHRSSQTADELYTLVDHGIAVLDVQVEHPLYGTLTGQLGVESRRDVDEFLRQASLCQAPFLLTLTDGHHLHSVRYPSSARLNQALVALAAKGIEVL
ncbi:MAG: transcription repressor NadR [Alicyclobacillaceae bacterium]|nr:transcription repressor NadR [Alicyclobacillaceae bacterium]